MNTIIVDLLDDPGFPNGYDFDIWVTDYKIGCYEGSGTAVGVKDGKFYVFGLGHCSFYGPLESSPDVFSIEDGLTSVLAEIPDNILAEIRKIKPDLFPYPTAEPVDELKSIKDKLVKAALDVMAYDPPETREFKLYIKLGDIVDAYWPVPAGE